MSRGWDWKDGHLLVSGGRTDWVQQGEAHVCKADTGR
jgi:hypothetical protein